MQTSDIKIKYINKAKDNNDFCVVVFTNVTQSPGSWAIAWQAIPKIERQKSFNYTLATSIQITWDKSKSGTPLVEVRDSSFTFEENGKSFSLVENDSTAKPNSFSVTNKASIPDGITVTSFKDSNPIAIKHTVAKDQQAKFLLKPKLYWAVIYDDIEVGEIVYLEDTYYYQEISIEDYKSLTVVLTGNAQDGYTFSVESDDVIEDEEPKDVIKDEESSDVTEDEESIDVTEDEESSDVIKDEEPKDVIEDEEPSDVIETEDIVTATSKTVFLDNQNYQDLFPFIYMRTWSEISPDALQKCFVQYAPPPEPSEGSLYYELIKLKQTNNSQTRSEMEKEAKSFIDAGFSESGKYAKQFIQKISDLKGYIQYFFILNDFLYQQSDITLSKLKGNLEKVIKLDWDNLKTYIASSDYIQEKDRVWQNYFALTIISEYRPHLLQELTKTLVMCHLIEKILEDDENSHSESAIITTEEILEAARATIILPTEIFPLPSASAGESKTIEWIEPYAIGDLQMVRQRLLRYELGEVAYIENVLKGERKETTQRKLNRVHQSVTNSSEQLEEIDDTRADILNEIQKTLAKDAVTTTFNNLSTNYGTTPPTATVTGGWTISHAPNITPPDKEKDLTQPYKEDVNNFAKDITTRTANRIARYVNQVRNISIIDESEETVIHAFDNQNSTNNIVGIYRWVNQVYTAHVVNYGHRLMLELMLENPADLYIKSLLQLQGISLEKPIAPDKLNTPIASYKDITRENYADLAIKYQVKDIPLPPDAEKIVPTAFKDGEPNTIKKILIPEGYRANSASVAGVFSDETKLTGFIGKQTFNLTTSPSQSDLEMNQEDSAIAASVLCNSAQDKSDIKYSVSIEVTCNLATEKFDEWRIKVYQAILEGYRQQQAEYYEKAGVGQAEIKSHNPLKNRQIEKYELKKACTRQMLKQHFQIVGASDEFAVNEPRYIQFFEQALEWNEITYHFYPKLAGEEKQDKFTLTAFNPYSGNDALFTSFLQAGAARVLVPVRPEYAMLVLYYLSSGTIWTGANALTPTDEKYVSLVNDLKILSQSDRECNHISKPWEITIPTSMIMLQDSSKLPQFQPVIH